MSDKRGILISFEGSEACGKTTQISRLAEHLGKAGHEVAVTREPGGTPLGEEIRHMLKHALYEVELFPETELLLFAASRAQLVREVIAPSLQTGKIVLTDRYLDSTTVYQGAARELSDDPVQMINRFAVGDLMPDLTIVIDIPEEVALERIKYRATDLPDRMEKQNIEFYQRVRRGYLLLAESLPERFIVIDGTKERRDVEAEIWKKVSERLQLDQPSAAASSRNSA